MSVLEERVRERLVERRAELVELTERHREARLVDLLRRVDDALGAIEVGEWGRCKSCHEAISADRLHDDPLVTVCLECLADEERRALERDLVSAARVQRALLPPAHLERGGWEIAYLWEPRGPVSGDHVDLVRDTCDATPFHLLLGDVSGKGIAASFLQSHLHALFRALAPAEMPLAELVGRANRLFSEATSNAKYATLVAARLFAEGRVELANAGHPRPLLADRRGVRPVEGGGVPLGLFSEATYTSREIPLAPGDTLLFYTDGWTEAEHAEEEFGIGRAAAALRRAAQLPLPELLAACREEQERFLAGERRSDDLSLVAVRRAAGAAPN